MPKKPPEAPSGDRQGMDEVSCNKCEGENPEQQVQKCQICHKYFCEDHTFTMSGVSFCSRGCGEYFFFGDPED